MGKAKWWVCDDCHSLNDLPANKCYNCRAGKPANPRQMDDHYAEIPSQQRVGITVDLSQLGDLTRPDPIETQDGGGIFEAFGDERAQQPQVEPPTRQPYDPYATTPEPTAPPAGVRPLREPMRRGIDQLGGRRSWAEAPDTTSAPLRPSPSGQPVPPAPPTSEATAGPPPAEGPRAPLASSPPSAATAPPPAAPLPAGLPPAAPPGARPQAPPPPPAAPAPPPGPVEPEEPA